MTDSDDVFLDGRPEPPPHNTPNVVKIKDFQHAGVAYGSLRVMSDIDAQQAPAREYYLKQILSPGELSVIYGEPGCGKSFWVVYITRAISQGREVLDRRVHQTNVLFMALEGAQGFQKRLRAEILTRDESEGFYYIAQAVNLFNDPRAIQDTIAAIQGTNAGIFIVDTLNRGLAGGSENDPADMGQFIKNIDAIRAATGAHGIVVHHSGKDASKGMRGHSSLLGAADVAIEVARTQTKARTATIRKAKDDIDGDVFTFQLDIHDLGLDADGDPITTCVVTETTLDGKPIKRVTLTPKEQLWLDTLKEFFARSEDIHLVAPEAEMAILPCATRDKIREWIKTRGLVGVAHSVAAPGVMTSTDRSKFSRMLEALKIKGKLGIHGNWIWVA